MVSVVADVVDDGVSLEFAALDTNSEGSIDKNVIRSILVDCDCGSEEDIDALIHSFDLRNPLKYREFFSWLFNDEVWEDACLGHPKRGVSVHHISNCLMERIRAAGKDVSATVYEIEPLVIRPPGAHIMCPRDSRPGAAYVDAIRGVEHAGMADIMLSYTWGYSVGDIDDTLKEFCKDKQLDVRKTYVWICCLCINQHRVKEAQEAKTVVPFEDFAREFGERVKGIGHVVAMMAPWHEPTYLSRVWCDFEMFTACQQKQDVQLTIYMPPKEEENFLAALLQETGVDRVWRACQTVKVEEAKASIKEDQEHILEMIREGPGYQHLNSIIVEKLQHWMVEVCESYLQDKMASSKHEDLNKMITLCQSVNKLLRGLEQFDRAATVLQAGLKLQKENGLLETPSGADMLHQFGILDRMRHNYESAHQHLEQALQISKKVDTLETTAEGALLYFEIGCLLLDQKKDGMEMLAHAKEVAEKIGKWSSNIGALILRFMGVAKDHQGDVAGALLLYEESLEVYKKNDSAFSPVGTYLLVSMAEAKIKQNDVASAVRHLKEAEHIRAQTRILQTREGLHVLSLLGDAYKLNNDMDAAIEAYKRAYTIANKLDLLRVPEAVELTKSMQSVNLKPEDALTTLYELLPRSSV